MGFFEFFVGIFVGFFVGNFLKEVSHTLLFFVRTFLKEGSDTSKNFPKRKVLEFDKIYQSLLSNSVWWADFLVSAQIIRYSR